MADDSSKKSESWLRRLGFDKGDDLTLSSLVEKCEKLHEAGLLGEDSARMIKAIVQSSDLIVRDIMVPRAKMVMLSIDEPFSEMLAKIIKSGHSRFPVLSENHEEIMGLLLSKDLLPHVGETDIDIYPLIRPVEYVPEGKFVAALINDFRAKRSHLALVVDEYGSVSGLITIEDLIEQIVGQIDDEHDITQSDEVFIKKLDDGRYIINALISLKEFNEYFEVDFDTEDVETISGLLMQQFGSLPKEGDLIEIDHFAFEVLPFEGNYLNYVELTIKIDE
ncbi:CBS domain-containing protein [Ignatzschineria sp. RMDPL8A]|uniref:transporter associated domain-containing protein n=1 Tax=Ignatzschineria sp. RMDPL8A TaxID=2999236 RepID=UPI0024466B0D|nr:transporter associated domain-containing protein [Ignatzschineria sp. RMDPL8A]MDG9729279.1 CBS domain-containing protein [Ignatzschineria sp. RMDPL8A]